MTLVLDDRRFIPFGMLLAFTLASMTILVVGRVQLPINQPQLIA